MSAPDTALAKQKRRHKGPLLGLTFLIGVVLLFVLWFVSRSADPEVTIDSAPDATTLAPAGDAPDPPAETLPQPSAPRD
ncbi:hypothetical protein [Rhodobaculum claviforme]|uniref:Uncharacterized protein n=1 Tax=Rhodobaculum claviforme TaxID=1549854 RepID=A0A934THR8_9RHOB|nr:hypothetical protein [Rhodobaculum claviforme]MBK5926449.1 hypothetical protein [Rhodobaculum claviforme]